MEEDKNYTKNSEQEEERRKNVLEYQRKFFEKKFKIKRGK